jgi:hypothetical protein
VSYTESHSLRQESLSDITYQTARIGANLRMANMDGETRTKAKERPTCMSGNNCTWEGDVAVILFYVLVTR